MKEQLLYITVDIPQHNILHDVFFLITLQIGPKGQDPVMMLGLAQQSLRFSTQDTIICNKQQRHKDGHEKVIVGQKDIEEPFYLQISGKGDKKKELHYQQIVVVWSIQVNKSCPFRQFL